MTDATRTFDTPPTLDLEESRKIMSPENLQRLIQLVAPRLQAGKRTMVYILPASSRFAHMALEPWALHTLHGDDFDEIIVVIRDRRLLPYGAGVHRLASSVVSFVETTNDHVVKLGHFDAPRMENGPLCLNLQSPQMLLQDLCRHLKSGGTARHLRLPPGMDQQADAFLASLGVRPEEPIVTVHMREGSYLASHRYHSFRVMTPANYIPAIRHLLDRGRWVFRLGDAKSTRLDIDHPRYVELPHLPTYQDYMDLALLARARFAWCCTSGPEGPARALGTPVLLVNAIIDPLFILNPDDLLHPKRYVDEATGATLSYERILFEGAIDYSLASEFEAARIAVRENTAEELLAAVVEMEARLDGVFDADTAVDTRFREISSRYAAHREANHKPHPTLNLPEITEFAFALPTTQLSHAFCRAHPEFLATE